MKQLIEGLYSPFLRKLSLFLALFLILSGCGTSRKPIKIGLLLSLSGRQSSIQLNARDGVILAVEEINRSGGINGRPIQLVVKDDKGDPELALRLTQELLDEEVTVILGAITSTIALKIAPLINQNSTILISLGAATSELSGFDDNVIRVTTPVDKRAPYYALLAYEKLNVKKVAIIYDESNPGYVLSASTHFIKHYEMLGGEVVAVVGFNSTEDFDSSERVAQALKDGVEGVYLIAKPFNAAILCQHIRLRDSNLKIIESEWGYSSPVFTETGGPPVEGVTSIGVMNFDSEQEFFVKFKKIYDARFNSSPSAYSVIGYEGMQILKVALSYTTESKRVKEVILREQSFKGVDGNILFDTYGDPERTVFYLEIREGKVTVTERIDPLSDN